jgi:phosphomannomutase
MASAPAFLNYTPVELAFGTSGMRGLVDDIRDLEAYISVKGALLYLRESGDIARGSTVLLGGDLRPSTERILGASLQAILDGGFAVEHAGKLPTPALMLRGLRAERATVMVTGSHIPFDRNGIKVGKAAGELLKSDEPGVLAAIARVRAEEYQRTAATSQFDSSGMLKQPPQLPEIDTTAQVEYATRYIDAFSPNALRGWRIAFYEHSAVGRDLIPIILASLGAVVIPVGRASSFVPIDTENITDEQLVFFEEMARSIGSIDAIVSTDGDSDRPLMLAVRPDRTVRFLGGDLLGLVVAEHLKSDAVAVPISANDAIDLRMAELGVDVHKTRIGSPYVIAALDQQRQAGARRVVGWEANGGFIVGSALEVRRGRLAALPTRDAVLPMVVNLVAAHEQGLRLDQLWDRLPQRFSRAGLIDEVPPRLSRAMIDRLTADASMISRFFAPRLGFGPVARISALDGLRIWFENGDVAHLRPSGNAPQLRIYSNAATQARADQIVTLGLAEDGILRTLQKALT